MAMLLPILTYHRISPPQAADPFAHLCTRPERLADHLRLLARIGFRTIGGAEIAAEVLDRQALASANPRAAMITFDDGAADLLDNALPLLSARGMKAVVFLVADRSGDRARWLDRDGRQGPPLLSWEQARQMAPSVEFGSHTLTHPHLPQLSRADKEREIRDSRKAIEDRLGRPVTLFAYPFGDCDAECVQVVRDAGYAAAVTTRRGSVHRPADLHELCRIPVHDGVTTWRLAYRVSWWYWVRYGIRDWLKSPW